MEHNTRLIGRHYLSPISGHPVATLACKFQPSLPMNSSQHRCINQSASEAETWQRSLNSGLGDTVGSPLVHLADRFVRHQPVGDPVFHYLRDLFL
ncbi:hypothetical protein TNCV_2857331 [Trichonephila clavipes]|nr:hypothetical protein TNCV_2857331 [Trichonephila clavipes]